MSYGYGSLGFSLPDASTLDSFLNHALVARRSRAVPLSKITDASQALDYAAGGFHVCVDKALSKPKGSASRVAWSYAAGRYYNASRGGTLGQIMPMLTEANQAADEAAKTEGKSINTHPDAPPPQDQPALQSSGFGMGLPGPTLSLPFVGEVPLLLPAAVLGMVIYMKKRGGKGRRAQKRSHRSRVRRMRRGR